MLVHFKKLVGLDASISLCCSFILANTGCLHNIYKFHPYSTPKKLYSPFPSVPFLHLCRRWVRFRQFSGSPPRSIGRQEAEAESVRRGKLELTRTILSVLPSSKMQKSCSLKTNCSKGQEQQYEVGSHSSCHSLVWHYAMHKIYFSVV